ncbi:MAG: hypothetical protein LQ343_004782 [Gyalolechia ehrenbergii]|nr:MAG: hypothetical protein LQ343_004782 [Gyalolechia ehrenbergii]
MEIPSLNNTRNMQPDLSSYSPAISYELHGRGPQPHSCVVCQRRKVKCDRANPCSNCVRHKVECEFRAPAPPRRRKRQSPDAHIHAKLRRYEDILQKYGVKPEDLKSGQDIDRPSNLVPPSARAKGEANTDIQNGSSTSENKPFLSQRKRKSPQSTPYAAVSEEIKHLEGLLEGSDDEDRKPGPGVIQRAYDQLLADGSGLLFGFSVTGNLKNLHPSPINIFRLWQTYINCVYPLSMIFHAPTVQQQILDASADLDNVSESMEALMFAIYYAAVVALSAEDCEAMFGIPQHVVMNKYMLATQQALNAAKLLKNLDIMVLQALVVFLGAARHSIDPRSLWIHCGTAIRLGERIGLHRDGTSLGLPPFETEMRRRLWWQIVVLDTRIAEISGAGTSILAAMFDTHLPSNVNDSNLNPEMGEIPPNHLGTTDMTFCLARYEIGNFLKRSNTTFLSFDGAWPNHTGVPTTIAEKDQAIDELEQRLEEKYLKHCDPQITLHFLTKMFSRTAVYKMRLTAHHPRHYPDKGTSMPMEEKDLLCRLSLNMIENDNLTHRNKSADKFAWFLNTFFQFPAFIYLLSELRHRTRGDLVDRGWQAINEGFQHRIQFIAEKKHSPIFQASAALALKAWQARELSAAAHNEPLPVPPEYILTLRSLFGEPPTKKQKTIVGAEPKYMHTPADSTTQGDAAAHRSEQHQANAAYNNEISAEAGENAPMSGTSTTEWTPMDWTYWDELISNWDPQVPDGSEQIDFGQPFSFGR